METRQDQPASGQLDWTDDIVVKTTKVLTTTGGTVWDAARRAAKYMQAMQQQIGLQEPGVKANATLYPVEVVEVDCFCQRLYKMAVDVGV